MAMNTTRTTGQPKRSNKALYLGIAILVIVAFILMYSNRATSQTRNSKDMVESTTKSINSNNTDHETKKNVERERQSGLRNPLSRTTDTTADQTSGLTTSDPDPRRGKSPNKKSNSSTNRNRQSETMKQDSSRSQNQPSNSDSDMNQREPNRN